MLKFKVNLFDKRIISVYSKIIGFIGTCLSFFLIFYDFPAEHRSFYGVLFLVSIVIIYLVIFIFANHRTKMKIKIGGSTVIVKKGDIFKEEGLKVIPFNEYFDTIVDNKIISETSLNGLFINNVYQNTDQLDEVIANDRELNKIKRIKEENIKRNGKDTKYKLGSSILVDDYVLTAFSNFDNENNAVLTMMDYINFLLTFWNEINRIYAQKSVVVPIFGSGITRFRGKFCDIQADELLSIMLWTFHLSETRFKIPSKLTIVIYGSSFDTINLFNLREGIV